MSRLLVVASPVYSTGGGLRHALAVARVATDAGWDTEVLVGCRREADGVGALVATVAPKAACRVHHGQAIRSLSWTLWRITLWRLRGSGLIYAPFAQAMLLAFLAATLVPGRGTLIAAFQGTPVPENVAQWKRPIYTRAFRRLIRSQSVHVAAVSRAQLEDAFGALAPGLEPHGTIIGNVAHGTGDAPWIQRRPPVRRGPPRGAPVAAILSRLSWEKGVDVAIRAAGLTVADITLAIGGDGPERARLTELAAVLGVSERVVFVGWCDPAVVLDDASIVLIPSRREGLPAVLLEAAWAHVPVVASNVGGIPEAAVGLPQVTLVPPDDAEELARAIDRALGASHEYADPSLNWKTFSLSVSSLLERCA